MFVHCLISDFLMYCCLVVYHYIDPRIKLSWYYRYVGPCFAYGIDHVFYMTRFHQTDQGSAVRITPPSALSHPNTYELNQEGNTRGGWSDHKEQAGAKASSETVTVITVNPQDLIPPVCFEHFFNIPESLHTVFGTVYIYSSRTKTTASKRMSQMV